MSVLTALSTTRSWAMAADPPLARWLPTLARQEVSRSPRLATFPADRLDRITVFSESRGDPNAVSPKGAMGRFQVMPATARDPGFGIRPWNGSQADLDRVGMEYRRVMQKRYGGDLGKMWAAYNAGPGRVDSAIKSRGEGWLQGLPAETRNYVAQNLRLLRGR